MTTSPVTKLTCGTRTLDLTTGRYRVDDDFVPPPYAMTPLIAYGTSANKSGGTLIDTKPQDRQWTFGVHISGSSDAEVRRAAADLQAFLSMAGDESNPLYLEHKQNSDTPEPLWGNHGANIKYEILTGTARISDLWAVSDLRARGLPACQVSLLVKPHAVGLRQRLGSAKGRIVEDVYGAADGVSRGLHISTSVTNKMTNPVFGASTWNTGWTADASLTASQNTDARFVLVGGLNSAKLFARATGQEFYQSINVGNTNTHTFVAYIMLPDLGTPSSSDVQLFYSTTLTTTFTNLGSGLWQLTSTAAGINAATNTGVQIKNGREIYLLYYGTIEESSGLNYVPIIGDHLGCAWSGSAHGSTSTSTAGRVRIAVATDTLDYQQGAVRLVWTPPIAYNAYSNGSYYMWSAAVAGNSLLCYFDGTNDRFTLFDGTNSANVAATFAANTPIVLHCVWSSAGLTLYVNGVSATATYTPGAAASYIYIGTNDTPGEYAGGVFGDLTIWGVALTATQVANDYANVAQLTADNQRVGCIPWLWTKDGDDIVDNCDDSTRDNWAVCGGIPGSAEAITRWKMTTSVEEYLLLANLPLSVGGFALPNANGIGLYVEGSGTAGAATDSNTDYKLTSVTTSYINIDSTNGMFFDGAAIQAVMRDLYDKEFYVFCRLYDEGSNLTLNLVTRAGTSGDWTSPSWTPTTAAAFRGLLSQIGVVFPSPKFRDLQTFNYLMHLQGKRTTGTANVRVDFVMAIPRPFFVISTTAFDSGTATTYTVCETSHMSSITRTNMIGDVVNIAPEKMNLVISIQYGDTPLSTWTNTFARVDVTPRYTLL